MWRRKSVLANGHPFPAQEDIANVALDTIWAASVGREARTVRSQLELLTARSTIDLPTHQHLPAVFPDAPTPDDVVCIRTVIGSIEVGLTSPLPRLSYFFYKKIPRVRRAFNRKDLMLANALRDSQARLGGDESGEAPIKSAMDYVLRREILQARKEKRPPLLNATVVKDELFGFLLAGHETTSATLMWGLKLLTDHQDIQSRLREAMRDAMPLAQSEGRQPTYTEIVSSTMPYFDAVVEEILRCGGTAATQARKTLVDTDLLGVHLPKGTNVMFMTNGPSFIAPPMHIDERLRSQNCQESKDKIGEWDHLGISEFNPERWLKRTDNGSIEFDMQAGPNTQFGGGARGCFGTLSLLLHTFYFYR